MDQVKKALATAAKHQFWIITGLATLIGCVAWFMINSTMTKLFDDNEKLIKDKVAAMGQVRSAVGTHPNKDSQTEMTKIIQTLEIDVKDAWKEQFKRQEQFLQWREDAMALPKLIARLKKLYPIELTLTFPEEPKEKVTDEEKRRFAKYFAEQMPELAKIIGVTWVGEASETAAVAGGYGGGSGGMGGRGGGPGGMGGGMSSMGGSGGSYSGAEGDGSGSGGSYSSAAANVNTSNDVVIWAKPSQDQLITSIRMWQGEEPSVYQMIYTQENMWILEGLFNIIEKTNRLENGNKATANFQAAVKKIEFIRIGRDAVANSGSITGLSSTAGNSSEMMGGSMGGSSMGMGGSSMGSGGSEMPSQMGMGSGSEGEGGVPSVSNYLRDPADGRYVDAAYKPITGDELRAKITSQSPEDAYFAVAKRIPVRMKIDIDYRRLPQFLAHCGNEGLMLEVKQVRVAAIDSAGGYGAGSGSGDGAGMMSGMGGRGGGMLGGLSGEGSSGESGMDGSGSGGSGYGGMGSGYGGMGSTIRTKKSSELPVEIYGVVYLFNPANTERLGLAKVTEDTQIKDTVVTPAESPVVPEVPATGDQPAAPTDNPAAPPTDGSNPNAGGTQPPPDTEPK